MSIAKRFVIATFLAGTAIPLAANAGTFTTLYTFKGGLMGGAPSGSLIYLNDEVYGTLPAYDTNISYLGNVYKVNAKTGAYKVVHAFQGGSDGIDPTSGVTYSGGLLYGTTDAGGGPGCVFDNIMYGCGTVFSIDPKTDDETILYEFSQDPNATNIGPGRLVDLAGTLYAASCCGGSDGIGSLFGFSLATGSFATVYSFSFADGRNPNPQLLYQDGLLYGTALYGGKGCIPLGGCGVVFSIDPSSGAEAVVHAFASNAGGKVPYSNLAYHADSLFADTFYGGSRACKRGCGTSFEIKAATGHERVLETFATKGVSYSGVTIVGGSVYETIPAGGTGYGELLQVDLKTGQQTVLYTFTGGTDGSGPQAPLTYHDGAFYGTTNGGNGTIFKYVR